MIETRDLTKTFDNFIAVDSLNLKIEKGEFFGLLGPNGAGKTTTISLLRLVREDQKTHLFQFSGSGNPLL